jgi:hypothetical protein
METQGNRYGASNGTSFGTLGMLWAVYGVMMIAAAAWIIVYSGTLTMMWGAIVSHVAESVCVDERVSFVSGRDGGDGADFGGALLPGRCGADAGRGIVEELGLAAACLECWERRRGSRWECLRWLFCFRRARGNSGSIGAQEAKEAEEKRNPALCLPPGCFLLFLCLLCPAAACLPTQFFAPLEH